MVVAAVRGVVVFALLACTAAFNKIDASSSLVQWVGRVKPDGRSVFFDWEGVSATVTVANFSMITATIEDHCQGSPIGGGSRWAVTFTPSDPNAGPPNHRISTFLTGELISEYYLFNDPSAGCDPNCHLRPGQAVFTLTRLTESRLTNCGPGGNLSVVAFTSDGVFVPSPAPPTRRLEFVGDSITAGDLNDAYPAKVCGNAMWNNDIDLSSGAIICKQYGADCMYTAWGGITLAGMRPLYPYTFSADGTNAYEPWAFDSWRPDAVVINLGTNDRPTPPALQWQSDYVDFVHSVAQRYGQQAPHFFLGYGPMTTEYQTMVTNVTSRLVAGGINATLLDLTLPHPTRGCYGHPSSDDNAEIAAKAGPKIATQLGWQ
mmetsp:Transcript_16426/g.39089  ORF Transcript_16426/g.39089 Transcript_16426/m.39089 type:complete len:374 (+) Transcript_16426:2-1123(+)